MWIKISEHEHDCTAPFPHLTDSMQLHRAAALPWRIKKLKAERPERGAWPLLTVETELNGVQMKGVLPWLAHWARRAGTRDCYPVLAALKYFFTLCVTIVRQSGQAAVPGSVCLVMKFFV